MTTKIMLINARQPEELRVSVLLSKFDYQTLRKNNNLLDSCELYDLDIENPQKNIKKGNIYLGTVIRVEKSLEAAFVEYGGNRQGFLPFKEISQEYLDPEVSITDGDPEQIKQQLEGKTVLIQIEKEERGNKGAALSTFISLAGCYLVLMPSNPKAGGISRRIVGEEREELKTMISELKIAPGMGVIIRTAGVGKDLEELQWDLDILVHTWEAIVAAAKRHNPPCLIHQESDVVIRALRDSLRKDVSEIIVDEPHAFDKINSYLKLVRSDDTSDLVKLYEDPTPMFSYFKIEKQIDSMMQRTITLPSGGSIVIDKMEAMTAIDINSAKATKGEDIEATALHTNLEAAKEIARQLRLRDVGGLVAIDFIDMMQEKHQREVENCLKTATKIDRARIQLAKISRFGILEMSRQRLRPSLGEQIHSLCPHCNGVGTTQTIKSLSLSILRTCEEYAAQADNITVKAELPLELATFLLNEKRASISTIEQRHNINVIILPNPNLTGSDYEIVKITKSGMAKLISPEKISQKQYSYHITNVEQPMVKYIEVPEKRKSYKKNLLKKIWTTLFTKENAGSVNEMSTASNGKSIKSKKTGSSQPKPKKPRAKKHESTSSDDSQPKKTKGRRRNIAHRRPTSKNPKSTNKSSSKPKTEQVTDESYK